MSTNETRDRLIERRQLDQDKNLWHQLTWSQRFSASSLTNSGYHLSFIRRSKGRSFAVLIKGGYCTTITDDGDINTTPIIHVRTL
jgi:hypothetical protein